MQYSQIIDYCIAHSITIYLSCAPPDIRNTRSSPSIAASRVKEDSSGSFPDHTGKTISPTGEWTDESPGASQEISEAHPSQNHAELPEQFTSPLTGTYSGASTQSRFRSQEPVSFPKKTRVPDEPVISRRRLLKMREWVIVWQPWPGRVDQNIKEAIWSDQIRFSMMNINRNIPDFSHQGINLVFIRSRETAWTWCPWARSSDTIWQPTNLVTQVTRICNDGNIVKNLLVSRQQISDKIHPQWNLILIHHTGFPGFS
jgi:hypothetical protein